MCAYYPHFSQPLNVKIVATLMSLVAYNASLWMHADGWFLSGLEVEIIPDLSTAKECWDRCLAQTLFTCRAVAYDARATRTCHLYDRIAAERDTNFQSAPTFTYYQYCSQGMPVIPT